jgi:CelD/BcsL family acetyltransferase involved in cellulose biosynthesis
VTAVRVEVVVVGLHSSLADSAPEASYALRTLTRLAGFAIDLRWLSDDAGDRCDVSYAPAGSHPETARIRIDALPEPMRAVWGAEPAGFSEQEGTGFLQFGDGPAGFTRGPDGTAHFASDIVRSTFWLLSGAGEPKYVRDRHGSAQLGDAFITRHRLLSRPLVSEYAALLRERLNAGGLTPVPLPWTGDRQAAFAFTHDVDYPQMIRWIECLRLAKDRGPKGLPSILGVLGGTNSFWKFGDWVAFEKRFATRPTFYFSSRQGSLWQYATGTPDCFYDVRAPEFRALFAILREEGCEIGLHASYDAYKSVATLAAERQVLREASGAPVTGNRHHYFRLDPAAPHETLARHEAAGFDYDSSLAHAYYPGFRRGICHPFHPFHPVERREIGTLQLPPAWMDDHYHRCLAINGIQDPETSAVELLDAVRRTGGVGIVDYHVRGMNEDFFPQYGAWLARFADSHFDASLRFMRPTDVATQYRAYEGAIDAASRDSTTRATARAVAAVASCTVGPLMPGEEPAWEAFVDSHPEATIYHTLDWRRVTETGLGHRSRYLRAVNPTGDLVGVLPLFEVNALGGRALVSVPLRDKGGPLVHHPTIAHKLAEASVALARSIRAKSVAIKFPPEGLESALSSAGFSEHRHWVTTVVPVAMGEEKLWNEVFRSPTRRAVNKARNSGLVPRWTTDDADLERFYEVFLMTRKALGVPAYPLSFFRAIWRHLLPSGRVRLLLVEREASIIGALLVFPYKREVVSAYMGSDPDLKDARVNDLLFWEAIRWSSEAGFESFYFGADSPLQEGLLAYKRKWGGRQFAIPHYHYTSNGAPHRSADSSSPEYARTRRLIAQLPLPIFRAFGAFAARRLW